jgi:hypothetical protein
LPAVPNELERVARVVMRIGERRRANSWSALAVGSTATIRSPSRRIV